MLPQKCLHTLWEFLSSLFAQFTKTKDAPRAYAPLVLKSFNLLPLLLELDSHESTNRKFDLALQFLTQNIRHLELQLDEVFSTNFLDGPRANLAATSISTVGVPNIHMIQNDMTFHIASAMTIATAQILNFTKDVDIVQPCSPEYTFLASERFHQYLLNLLHASNHPVLNFAALNLFEFRLLNLLPDGVSEKKQACLVFEKMFPRIVELLNHDVQTMKQIPGYLRLPITILSDLCIKYPKFCVQLKNTGVDKQIMADLATLIEFSPVLSFIQMAKRAYKDSKGIMDFSALIKHVRGLKTELWLAQKSEISLIANHLLLLSVLTSSSEDFRRRITSFSTGKESKSEPNFLCLAIFEVIENYQFMCTQLILGYKAFWKLQEAPSSEPSNKLLEWLGENVSVLLTLLEHPLNTNAFYLMRSLSRSVSTLRTFFVDCNSIKSSFVTFDANVPRSLISKRKVNQGNVISDISARYDRDSTPNKKGNLISCLLKIISRMSVVDHVVDFFASTKTGLFGKQRIARKALCEKKIVTLAILANFILDFSSFRHEIVNHDRILRNLALLFKSSIRSRNQGEKIENSGNEVHEIAFEQLKIQMGILQVIKNYLYNETEENRRMIWDFFPLSLIFELSLYGVFVDTEADSQLHEIRLQQKIIAFEILRNLTAASPYFSEAIEKLYVEFATRNANFQPLPRTWNKYILESLLSFDLFLPFKNLRSDIDKLFLKDDEFVLRIVHKTDYFKLLVAINYLEDHRYTNISFLRVSDFPQRPLLRVWKRLLEVKLLKSLETKLCGLDANEIIKLANHLNEVKISITWILINLTWKNDISSYHAFEGSNFRLMDVIHTPQNSAFSISQFNQSGISVGDFEEQEEDDPADSYDTAGGSQRSSLDNEISLKKRAEILYKAGFCEVLETLIDDLSRPKPTFKQSKYLSIERFDSLNSNDLFEKCRTAQSQIVGFIPALDDSATSHPRMHLPQNQSGLYPLRRLSNIASSRESVHRDVRQRGDEFEYWSDDGNEDTLSRLRDESVRAAARSEREPVDEDDQFDEYWLH
ncbi:hypothetical protein METBIDRAFT_45154 [Metschnikowia bicuspidata var. bicuspidata NRRL YB-4993]|uniref:Uncharacterized protein n=1 Tax=Metschnikowia bicuspidata var. bicuspidata NRRL YB-4993 TaxID=869754 RepID=A0A1A0H7F2_9ASCO|nr:hypothetical protein METBIDRAFT_45154 [Metschnikowia bicuspidata var. bicuspidata NRRL YB-4993]OBA19828.1 hypothetical protein METBIDRAFT_45154 [Metschnikowia bicuspidata var. bicuspidata NRRL YB-4993]